MTANKTLNTSPADTSARASKQALDYLSAATRDRLLSGVGQMIPDFEAAAGYDCRFLQESSKKSKDHLLTGKGLFFVTESGKLMLDCTAGHYQMPWGYSPDEISETILEGMKNGIVWDCHSDVPGNPVKALANQLIATANGLDSPDDPALTGLVEKDNCLNRVLMSACTGTVACIGAFRMAYVYYQKHYSDLGAPVFITFENNYHGTDTFAQTLRGMWPGMLNEKSVVSVQVKPNNTAQIKEVFAKYGKRAACFAFEPVMMNNEAVLVTQETVNLMRKLTAESDAMLMVDEIQSCFFVPELMMFRQYKMVPDAVIVGKGMTAGFHGQAATIFKKKYDLLAQYDALSTNGNAPLACLASLKNIEMIQHNRERLTEMQNLYFSELEKVASEFPQLIEGSMGRGLLSGLKFKDRDKAIAARTALLDQGLWVRVHAYKEGHRTLLMKFGLIVDEPVISFFMNKLREVLKAL